MSLEVVIGAVGIVVFTLVFIGGLLWALSLEDSEGT